eukprot:958705-Amphidinium_carterae.4
MALHCHHVYSRSKCGSLRGEFSARLTSACAYGCDCTTGDGSATVYRYFAATQSAQRAGSFGDSSYYIALTSILKSYSRLEDLVSVADCEPDDPLLYRK